MQLAAVTILGSLLGATCESYSRYPPTFTAVYSTKNNIHHREQNGMSDYGSTDTTLSYITQWWKTSQLDRREHSQGISQYSCSEKTYSGDPQACCKGGSPCLTEECPSSGQFSNCDHTTKVQDTTTILRYDASMEFTVLSNGTCSCSSLQPHHEISSLGPFSRFFTDSYDFSPYTHNLSCSSTQCSVGFEDTTQCADGSGIANHDTGKFFLGFDPAAAGSPTNVMEFNEHDTGENRFGCNSISYDGTNVTRKFLSFVPLEQIDMHKFNIPSSCTKSCTPPPDVCASTKDCKQGTHCATDAKQPYYCRPNTHVPAPPLPNIHR